ncbi:MAG: hypothetical protein IKM09_04980 [Clostridia bacterium]|nr:hypothetical protein [Clostridia bacterium]
MTKKETVTKREIIKDIRNSIKHPVTDESEKSYRKYRPLYFLLGIVFVIPVMMYPKTTSIVLCAAIPCLFFIAFIDKLILNSKAKRARIDDYEIVSDILSHKQHEHYCEKIASVGGIASRRRVVSFYVLHFESGRSWRITSENNYSWSERYVGQSDDILFESSHRGDSFITVIDKKTQNIVTVYNEAFFKYKEQP